jgi:hypothetical protein
LDNHQIQNEDQDAVPLLDKPHEHVTFMRALFLPGVIMVAFFKIINAVCQHKK